MSLASHNIDSYNWSITLNSNTPLAVTRNCCTEGIDLRAVLQNSDVRQMYLNAQSEWLNHISVSDVMLHI